MQHSQPKHKKPKKTYENKERTGFEYKGKRSEDDNGENSGIKELYHKKGGSDYQKGVALGGVNKKPLSLQELQHAAQQAFKFPEPEKGRPWTVSIAIPGSILDGSLTVELKTYLVGQIARACVLYNVDEIVIYNESAKGLSKEGLGKDDYLPKSDPDLFMGRVLQYLETPLYLRKLLFPMHRDLKFAGLLNPLDPPHHVHVDDRSLFREGVVIRAGATTKDGKCTTSIVNCGMRKEVLIDRAIPTGVRVTVRITGAKKDKDQKNEEKLSKQEAKNKASIAKMEAQLLDQSGDLTGNQRYFAGTVVSPKTPREETGYYWGYQVRLADAVSKVFTESPYADGYDLTIGTSDKGKLITPQEAMTTVPKFQHALLVFGGNNGIETAVEADEDLKCQAEDTNELFDFWWNTLPNQGSRVVRTEEALLVTLAQFQSIFVAKGV